jgi:hypothetical protein
MMKWNETTASRCRYGDVAGRLFGEAEVIWEHSENGWHGYANVLVRTPDGHFVHYAWTYGSCSHCDDWWDLPGGEDAVEQIMRDAAAWFDDEATLRRYLHLEDSDATYPTGNSPTNDSILGMLRILDDIGEDLKAMGDAFDSWSKAHT